MVDVSLEVGLVVPYDVKYRLGKLQFLDDVGDPEGPRAVIGHVF